MRNNADGRPLGESSPRGEAGRLLAGGLTLVEVLVTVSMLALLSSMMIFNYPRFSENYRLDSAASAVAAILNEAESRALGIAGSTSGVFPGFGVYFDVSTPSEYILFSDETPANGLYDAGEEIKRVMLGSPFLLIADLCVNSQTGGNCVSPDVTSLDVVYLFRIGPEPVITIYANGSTATNYSNAEVVITGSFGGGRGVIPWVTGYVEIFRR